MAVEAHHLNLFLPQSLSYRDLMNPIDGSGGIQNTQTGYDGVPLSGTTIAALPMPSSVNNNIIADSPDPRVMKQGIQSVDRSVMSNRKNSNDFSVLHNSSRKRAREDCVVDPLISQVSSVQNQKSCNPLYFLGHDMSLYIQQQQLDIDRLIYYHMERVKMEIEEKRKREGRRIMEELEESAMKRLRAKEEEIYTIVKLNHALEEKVKSLYLENQIWREVAETNEATANALRTNLEQVLAVAEQKTGGGAIGEDAGARELADDAVSFCGSCGGEDEDEEDKEKTWERKGRMCRNCGKEEAGVLLLPCRHLCLCAACGSTLHTCPICKSVKNASVHLNLSS